jgi:5-methylcytosine-specific restriction endonuclease McrA
MAKVPRRVVEISEKLASGHAPRRFRVRAILAWFGVSRRGINVLTEIQKTLSDFGLETVPQLDRAGIDDFIQFQTAKSAVNDAGAVVPPISSGAATAPEQSFTETDPVHQTNSKSESAGPNEDHLEPEHDEESEEVRPDDRPVTSQPYDWSISTLRDKLDRGLLDLQPKFQREYVWNIRPELPSRLIESFLLEIPVPPIYFGKIENGRLEVIDGQQRLTTLVYFVTNRFSLRKLQRMSSLNDKYFRDLTKEQQEKILDAPIRSIVIDAARNTDLRYEVFERLNRGSMSLNEQELRNCVYRGLFNDLLAELEKDQVWRRIKGTSEPERRFIERENILRFFAFANRLSQYSGSLKRFLNDYMGPFAPREPEQLKAHTALFKQTMQNIYAVFGEHSCRLYEVGPRSNRGSWDPKFSIAALDIQASALMNRPPAKVQQSAEQIRELFLFTLLTDTVMQDSISRRKGSTSQTTVRWTRFRELVDPIIAGTVVEPRFFDFAFRKALFQSSNMCRLCQNEIHTFEDCTVDHITPYSKGGKTVSENAQLAHRACNARKNAQLPSPAS